MVRWEGRFLSTWAVLLDILVLLAAALVLGVVFERLRQSAILGYLAAGTLLGPGALDLVGSGEAVTIMAELGAALLLFSIGLEFSWRRLRRLGRLALLGGALQIVLTGCLVAAVGMILGLGARTAVALGAMLAPSSTACVLRMLTERAELDSVHGRGALGILLLQDIALVPLVLLVTTLGAEGTAFQVFHGIGRAVGLAALLVAAFYLAANYVLPRLLDATALSKNRELPILLACATCLGAAWAAHRLELSPALGAFIAGLLLAESPFATQVRSDVGVLRTLFVTLFFTSIGMVADPGGMWHHWAMVLGLAVAIIVGKALLIWPIVRLFGYPHRHALATAASLGQVGEFSFVLAQVALLAGILATGLFQAIVSATLVTLFLTPYLVAAAPRLGEWAGRRLDKAANHLEAAPKGAQRLRDHVIIVGFGPAGRGVAEALSQTGTPFVVVELNPRTVAAAMEAGVPAVVGDATQEQILEHLRVSAARAVVVALPDHRTALQVIGQARSLAPHTAVIARARYQIFAGELERAGAWVIVDEEQETGRLLGQEVLGLVKGVAAAARPATA